jgi:hypothetical protein
MVRRVLREQFSILHRRLLAIVRDDEVCRRLMTVPGVGPVVALTYRATVDVPARFRNSKAVGAVFGLTPTGVTPLAASHKRSSFERSFATTDCGPDARNFIPMACAGRDRCRFRYRSNISPAMNVSPAAEIDTSRKHAF